jgi:hypothetical protein|tara:strand:- start:361 stop:714 length:354 start_codon:yes stop_codon:yes gene_type:complete
VAKEVAPFGIVFIIAEPGPTATQFAEGLDRTATMPIYEDSPAGELRRALASGDLAIKGDAGNTVKAIIKVADMTAPPLRLTLGSTAYESISHALKERSESLETYKDMALSADRKEVA